MDAPRARHIPWLWGDFDERLVQPTPRGQRTGRSWSLSKCSATSSFRSATVRVAVVRAKWTSSSPCRRRPRRAPWRPPGRDLERLAAGPDLGRGCALCGPRVAAEAERCEQPRRPRDRRSCRDAQRRVTRTAHRRAHRIGRDVVTSVHTWNYDLRSPACQARGRSF